MSLFGTGRREGIIAVCLIGLLTAVTHLAAALRHGLITEATHVTMVAGAVGGMLTYRFLRSQGRSRYAGFLGGAAYGMSPLFAGLIDTPREQLAAALVPLALEAACHITRPSTQRTWLPWTGLCIAAPFAFGVTVIATLATTLAVGTLAITVIRSRQSIDHERQIAIGLTIFIGALALTNLAWLDPLAGWLGTQQASNPQDVLSGEATPIVIARVTGPFLVWFALFGILRRQRQVMTSLWLTLAMAGAMPTILLTIPGISASMPTASTVWTVATMSLWLSVLAIIVVGTASLDDWFDQPQRRRGAHLSLLLLTLFVAPALPLAGASVDPIHLATVLGTFGLVAIVTTGWRRLGILRFKNVLAIAAIAALSIPVILQMRPDQNLAAPIGETAGRSWQRVADGLLSQPYWHYGGLIVAVLAGVMFSARMTRWSKPAR